MDACKEAGQVLLTLVGEPDRPEVEQKITELDGVWDTVTGLFHKRHSNLLEALDRAMAFHHSLRGLLEWLEGAEGRVGALAPVGQGAAEIQFRLRFSSVADNDGQPDLALFYLTDSNTNEPGIFELSITADR